MTRSSEGLRSKARVVALGVAWLALSCAGENDEECKQEAFPYRDNTLLVPGGGNATRVPLKVFCGERGCPTDEATYTSALICHDVLADGGIASMPVGDAGISSGLFRWMARAEGCGSVEFYMLSPSWPRYLNFDVDSGALIGAGSVDDVGTKLRGSSCLAASYVAGTIAPRCADASVKYCERR